MRSCLAALACLCLLGACTDAGCVRHTDCASRQMCVDARCVAAAAGSPDAGAQAGAGPRAAEARDTETDTDADGG